MTPEPKRIAVNPELLAYPHWEGDQWNQTRGPWYDTSSTDTIAEGRIRQPLQIGRRLFTNLGSSSMENEAGLFEAWQLIHIDQWNSQRDGNPTSYRDKAATVAAENEYSLDYLDADDRDWIESELMEGEDIAHDAAWCRSDPRGFYHRMKVSWKGETYVVAGPPVYLVPDESLRPAAQLTLF